MRLIFFLSFCTFLGCSLTQNEKLLKKNKEVRFAPHDGDLLFLELDCPLCHLIAHTTSEQHNVSHPMVSHVGILSSEKNGEKVVLEAWPKGGVRKTSLSRFLNRNYIKAYALRLPLNDQRRVKKALRFILNQLGKPYDGYFIKGDQTYYCSELIADAMNQSHTPYFRYAPMFFGKKESSARKAWLSYFAKKGYPIPDNQLGISPLAIYLQARVKGAKSVDLGLFKVKAK